jgi:hypothetical protein
MVVPHVEAGYRGALPTKLIAEVLSLELKEDPQSHAAMLRRANEAAG